MYALFNQMLSLYMHVHFGLGAQTTPSLPGMAELPEVLLSRGAAASHTGTILLWLSLIRCRRLHIVTAFHKPWQRVICIATDWLFALRSLLTIAHQT